MGYLMSDCYLRFFMDMKVNDETGTARTEKLSKWQKKKTLL